jgi:osmoprotectant transport system permease protein
MKWIVFLLPFLLAADKSPEQPRVQVGSKAFPESVIIGEMVRLLDESAGIDAIHYRWLGDTSKTWNPLLLGQLDVYCEYTGTLTQEILSKENIRTDEQLRDALARYGLRMSRSLGFSNNYALGMKEERAQELGIRTISDLKNHPELHLGLSNTMIERGDGWKGLKQRYGLPFQTPESMDHSLSYPALNNGTIDVTDVYTTDAQIRQYGLRVLIDDLGYFPAYAAVLLYRADLEKRMPEAVAAMKRLEGKISVEQMIDLNAQAVIEKQTETRIAAEFLKKQFGIQLNVEHESLVNRVWKSTREHLFLVLTSLALAVVTAIPLGILAARWPVAGQGILAVVGIIQTIPSLALLTFLLILLQPLLALLKDLGTVPAIVALYLYSLLPLVRSTQTGLLDIPLSVRESAEALGLSWIAKLVWIELPMASRNILSGVKTASVLNVGFATLGGLIGAGGYGQVIMTGLAKSDTQLLLEGSIPAVLMALAFQGAFELAERWLVPRGLRLRPSE